MNEFLKLRSPGYLSEVCFSKSNTREGYYVIVDYSGSKKEVLYYEDSSGFTETGIGGLRTVFSFKEVTLSQGELLEVFSAGNMGTGYLYLYENNSDYTLQYSIEDLYVIDKNMDVKSYEELPEELKESLGIEDGDYVSWVHANGRLDVEYNDFNSDGHTDIRLYGIKQMLVTQPSQIAEPRIVAEEFCIYTYLFSPEANSFILHQEILTPLTLD